MLRSWWASATYLGASILVGVCAMGLLLAVLPDSESIGDLALAVWLLLVPAAVGCVLAWRIAVRVQGDEILIVNPFRTHRVSRHDIGAVELGRENYVVGAGRSLPMLRVHVRGRSPVNIVAAIRVTEAGRESAKRALLATRRGETADSEQGR